MNKSRRRVLCVDGSEDICVVETAMLRRAGYEVSSALGMSEALGLSRVGRFDLYLVAYIISDGTGVELCRRLREHDKETPIIFWSSRVYPSDRQAALDAGADAFLRKPDDVDILIETATRLLTAVKEPRTEAASSSP